MDGGGRFALAPIRCFSFGRRVCAVGANLQTRLLSSPRFQDEAMNCASRSYGHRHFCERIS